MQLAPLDQTLIEAIVGRDGGNGWKNDPEHWARVLHEAEAGSRAVLVASIGDAVCGYGSLLWHSAYPAFRSAGIPEIHDLSTAAAYRGRGLATSLIAAFERIAAERGCATVGLGVGLYADYGPAQRLYASLGYKPDGLGVTYNCEPVVPGAAHPVDDDLVLWLIKQL